MTPQKVEEFDAIRNIKEETRLLNNEIASVTDELFSEKYKIRTFEELQGKIKTIQARLKSLVELKNKSRATEFEIESFSKLLDKIKALKI